MSLNFPSPGTTADEVLRIHKTKYSTARSRAGTNAHRDQKQEETE